MTTAKFQWPPRPESKISPELISFYENRGWWAQLKKNGTLQVIFVTPDGRVFFKTRQNEDNKAWKPTADLISHFAFHKDSVFVAELLHNKDKSVKNTLYVFDVLRFEGKKLIGTKLKDRVELLHNEFPGYIGPGGRIDIAGWYKFELAALFDSLRDPINEGLVLKDPESILKPPLKPDSNSAWQVKVRKAHKNYGF